MESSAIEKRGRALGWALWIACAGGLALLLLRVVDEELMSSLLAVLVPFAVLAGG